MKRLTKVFALIAAVALIGTSAYTQGVDYSIEQVTNTFSPTQLTAGNDHQAQIRVTNNTGLGGWNYSTGFEVSSPDGATWGLPVADTMVFISPVFDDGALFAQRFRNRFGVDGAGADTFAYAGVTFSPTGGVPAGFDDVAFGFTFISNLADSNLTICVDSVTNFPPTNVWIWSNADITQADVLPTWSGEECFTVFNVPDLPPDITNCPTNVTGSVCETLTETFQGFDAEGSPFTFEIVSGPGAIDANSGVYTFSPTNADVLASPITVEVAARDGVTGVLGPVCQFDLVVTNTAPSITNCPGSNLTGVVGKDATTDLDAADPDVCQTLAWSVVGGSAAGVASVDANGVVTFTPDAADVGTVTVEVEVSDGLETDLCVLTFDVTAGAPYGIRIEKIHNQLQGQFTTVNVILESIDANEGLGGFDLLIKYDNSALSLQQAVPGDIYAECGWEYFDYRFGANGNCDGGCPSGVVRVVGLAETNNGPNFAGCTPTYVGTTPVSLAGLVFLVSNDRTLECQYVPVRFFWLDCGDNTLSNATGTELYINSAIYEYRGDDALFGANGNPDIADGSFGFPGYVGAPDVPCLDGDKEVPERNIDFQNGGVDIICADSIDDRGDINLNGLAYEIADAVMFTRYFLVGLSAFPFIEGSIAASDVNNDGNPLTVADLVTLIRVVVGDELGIPKAAPAVNADYTLAANGVVSLRGEAAAAHLVVSGNVTPTVLVDAELGYEYDAANDVTSILVYPAIVEGNTVDNFTGDFVNVGNGEIVSIELATAAGSPVVTNPLPTSFALEQNYPNPFNPTTTIAFTLPVSGQYEMTIYNAIGQVVEVIAGNGSAGPATIEWDAGNYASGVYFYKLSAGAESITKKMVFLK